MESCLSSVHLSQLRRISVPLSLKVHQTPLRRALNLPLDVSLRVWRLGNNLVSAWSSAEGGAVISNKQGGVVGRELNWPSKDLLSVTD